MRRKYLPRIAGAHDVAPYVICLDDTPIGYIQLYPIDAGAWGLPEVDGGVGVDLFIGDARYLHRGLGPKLLRQFVQDIAFQEAAVKACFIDPSPRNRIAIRAFEKAGFRRISAATDPESGQEVQLMRAARREFGMGA